MTTRGAEKTKIAPEEHDLSIFSRIVWRPTDLIEIRLFKKGTGGPSYWYPAAELHKAVEYLEGQNAAGWGIYAGVVPRKERGGKKKKDAADKATTVWLDIDLTPAGTEIRPPATRDDIDKCLEALRALGLPEPSLVINSGHGGHFYWPLREPHNSDEIELLNKALAGITGGDLSPTHKGAPMRLPGFVNHKPEAAITFIDRHNNTRHDFAELQRIIDAVAPLAPERATEENEAIIDFPEDIESARAHLEAITPENMGDAFKHFAHLRHNLNLSGPTVVKLFTEWNDEHGYFSQKDIEDLTRNGNKYAKGEPGTKTYDAAVKEKARKLKIAAAAQKMNAKIEAEEAKQTDLAKHDEDIRDIEAATIKTLADRPPQTEPLFTLIGQKVATRQSLVMIQAMPKAGKTGAVGAMIAATMNPTGDCLGFASSNPEGKAVIHIDTEQNDEDHFDVIETAVIRRAGLKDIPPWFKSIKAIPWDIPDRYRKTLKAIEHYGSLFGGVHSVFLDGAADLLLDTNDKNEGERVPKELQKAANKYDCAIICVVHENPGKDNADHGKTRGHFGSELHRKVYASIRLTAAKDGITTISLKAGRRARIAENDGPRFLWSTQHGMHILTETKAAKMAKTQDERDRTLVDDIMADGEKLQAATIKERICDFDEVKEPTAKKRMKYLVDQGWIERISHGLYRKILERRGL